VARMGRREMGMSEIETCCKCGEATGRAGKGEDSIYCDECDAGPFCMDCINDSKGRCPICDAIIDEDW